MSMKPRLDDKAGSLDPKLVTHANCYDGAESSPNTSGTVSNAKPATNSKITPNVVSGPKQHGG